MSTIAKGIGRRIVTGHDTQGKSVILSDGVPPQDNPMTGNGADFIEIWSSAESLPTLTATPASEPALRDFREASRRAPTDPVPIEDAAPVIEVMKPILISACAASARPSGAIPITATTTARSRL